MGAVALAGAKMLHIQQPRNHFSDQMCKIVAFALLCLMCIWVPVGAKPQELVQPQWNWEEVILSRNGPSTTTTPRPSTTWYSTTLRSFEPDKISGHGLGTIEEAILVPHHEPLTANSPTTSNNSNLMVLTSVALILRAYLL